MRGLAATASLFVALTIAAGCSSASDTSHPNAASLTPSQTATATPVVTPEVTASPTTPAATRFQPKSLFDAEFESTTFATVQNSVNSVFEIHPDVTSFKDKAGNSTSKEVMLSYVLPGCQSGNAEDQGVPKLVILDRIANCSSMASSFYRVYVDTGDELYLKAAVDAYNYAKTEFPDRIADINDSLRGFGAT